MSITHAHVTEVADDPTKDVSANKWNAGHVFTGLTQVINVVTDYDATGDGETDDTAAVQAAIDAAEAAGGGLVFFPAGTYVLAGVTVDADNVLLAGVGPASKLIPAGASDDLVTFKNCDFWGIRDFSLDGAWNGSRGIVLLGARWGTVLNIVGDAFFEPLLDLRADGDATQNVNNNLIQHVHAKNCVRFIRLKGGSLSSVVSLNVFEQISAIGAGTAQSTLIDIAAYADTNKFGFTRLSPVYAGSIGVILNSDSAAATREVYGNMFDELAIDQDGASTVSVQVNDTSSTFGIWANIIEHIRPGGSNPTPPVLAGATSYIAIGHQLGTFPTASLPAATGEVPGTQAWDTTTSSPKWSTGAAWVEASMTDHDHDSDYAAADHDHDADYEAAGAVAAAASSYEVAGAVTSHAGAADPHAGYVKESDLDTLFVWAEDMSNVGGSLAGTNINRWLVRGFDASSVENASKMVQVPAHWTTFDLAILWANGGAGAGDVVWGAGIAVAGSTGGTSLTAPSYTEVAAVTAGAQNAVISTAILTGQSPAANKTCLVSVRRKADDAADTLANDSNLVAAVLTRAS